MYGDNNMNKEIVKLIESRLNHGKREYNQELNPFDGRVWELEALEEILDGMVYTATAILKIIKQKELTNSKFNRRNINSTYRKTKTSIK